jgi:hypothetical protein
MAETIDTHAKALQINLDNKIYGTFAEIGAGQEVARWFLQVGGAAGTVAKTISAYDMTFSDEIYGRGPRYVSRDRLLGMLDHEYGLLPERLDQSHGADTRFFAFADSVAARNYAGTNECHGWMGIRFQSAPRSEPSEVLLHINMLDPTNLEQQRALGLLGVNLVHGIFFQRGSVNELLGCLLDDLSLDRIEIDVMELRGPAFGEVDPVTVGVRLVTEGLARSVLFREGGTPVQPSDLLRKRPVVIARGLFDSPLLPVQHEMLEAAARHLRAEAESDREPLAIPEMTIRPVQEGRAPDEEEAVRRFREALSLDRPTLLTRFPESYHLTGYLRRYTQAPLRFVFGPSTLVQMIYEARTSGLLGGRLEALGRLLAENVKVYVYPMESATFRRILDGAGASPALGDVPQEGLVTAGSIQLVPPLGHLYDYFREAGWVTDIEPEA